ncbi:serine/threonine-protein phosphatase 2A activator-like [Daphnia carinata]|uniref:serine/threonine-protein phosphatase 2A activator-like n=1 Tax=Daphnia carinata TaxID=120202 RepID=UPI00257CC5E4|nr:serine/threonine-protein phosphatase 2A activator-like [Daphnia carinata]
MLAPPKKEIFNPDDMSKWLKSEAYQEYLGFILSINEAVQGKKWSSIQVLNDRIEKVVKLLDCLDRWIDEIPPTEQPQRFGNKSFRVWFQKFKDESSNMLKDILPQELHYSIPEIEVYLTESVGNSTRIDYGSGHEMSFVIFLFCLFKIGFLTLDDRAAAGVIIFERYMSLMRKLQLTYRMEPAGSHGVWSLDDYQFVPFIWGSSQLVEHQRLPPKSFPNPDIVESFAKDYMFLGCIKFIFRVKNGPFAEHSNQLWNISGVGTWSKVNSGLIKMYKAEVLAKYPVIQHVLFGSLLSIKEANFQEQ